MFNIIVDKSILLVSCLPNLYFILKILTDLNQPTSSKTLLLKYLFFSAFTITFSIVSKDLGLLDNVALWIQTISKLIIIAIPNLLMKTIVDFIVSIRNQIVNLHPLTQYKRIKHKWAVKSIESNIQAINKFIKLLPDEQKRQLRDRILATIFEQHPKNYVENQVQCEIISYKIPEIKQYKPFQTVKQTTPVVNSNLKNANLPQTKSNITPRIKAQQKKQQQHKNSMTERISQVQKTQFSERASLNSMSSSMTFKRSDVIVSEETPPKYHRPIQTNTTNTQFRKKQLKEQDLSQKFNLSMSQLSGLLDQEQESFAKSSSFKPAIPPQVSKKLLSKVEIYKQSEVDSSKLQKLILNLYQGDQVQLLTLNNSLIQVIILLKMTAISNGYFQAKGYSSVAGMCTRIFKFKGDYSAFKKYIQTK